MEAALPNLVNRVGQVATYVSPAGLFFGRHFKVFTTEVLHTALKKSQQTACQNSPKEKVKNSEICCKCIVSFMCCFFFLPKGFIRLFESFLLCDLDE